MATVSYAQRQSWPGLAEATANSLGAVFPTWNLR
jgi:hypothetical protein